MNTLRTRILAAMGLGTLVACTPVTVTIDTGDSATTDDSGTTDDTGELTRVCDAGLTVLTREEALQLDWDGDDFLVCAGSGEECADLEELNVYSHLVEAIGEHPDPDFCGWWGEASCYESTITDSCCYQMTVYQGCEGRPLRVDGVAIRAPLVFPGGALEAPPDVAFLHAHWARAGLDEHASVAAFARFALQLGALGAPPDLLAACAAAMKDEVHHAALCFDLAARFGPTVAAGPLPLPALGPADFSAILREHIQDACINETICAAWAAAARDAATDPEARAALTTIAEDEARHAALAWRTLRWMLEERPDLAPVAASELHTTLVVDTANPGDPANGVLDGATKARIAQQTLARVIRPCAEDLLEALGPAPDSRRRQRIVV